MNKTLFLQSLLLILHFTFCTSKDSMSMNQTLRDGEVLISKGNLFALGFFSPPNSQHKYLGIWFHNVSQKTVVWVANRDSPITASSSGVLSISQLGNLFLYSTDDNGQQLSIWSTNLPISSEDSYAARLLDSGNFVLTQHRGGILWESFDYPTNTLLQGMKLGLNRKTGLNRSLTSWKSADDPGTGEYLYKLVPGSSPQVFLYKHEKPILRSSPWPWESKTNVINYTMVNSQDEVYFSFYLDNPSTILIFQIDHSGLVKTLTWHQTDGQWKEFWTGPKYKCELYGQCGVYSICDPNNDYKFQCDCLPGYEPKLPMDWHLRDGSGGCVRKRLESSSVCGDGEGFVKVQKVVLPDTSTAVWVDMNINLVDCELGCKRNCLCSAFTSIDIPGEGTGCLVWYGELMDTRYASNSTYDLYVRVDALEVAAEKARKSENVPHKKMKLAILIPSIASAWIAIITFACLWLRKKLKKVHKQSSFRLFDRELQFFEFSIISAAANHFSASNKLGQGGFGSVYKGELSNGREIAIKRLSKNSGQGVNEFTNEAMLIAKLQHRNLVQLLGCCIQGGEQILIYEYMPNKSLDYFLFDQKRKRFLDWSRRFNIITGIARGILYLHQDSRLTIIHRDLKCSNILLDVEMNPKISDFGMARIFSGDQVHNMTTRIAGTYGYMSPEYAAFGKYSEKSDVFSFGVIVLEILSGKRNSSFHGESSSPTLIGHVWELWRHDKGTETLDLSLQTYDCEEALRCIQIALLCVQEDVMDRPSMSALLFMLNNETTLPSPRQPAFTFRNSCNTTKSVQPDATPYSVNEMTITTTLTR